MVEISYHNNKTMDAKWFHSVVANGCFETQVLGAVPPKDALLLHRSRSRAGVLRLYKVCGVRPTTAHLLVYQMRSIAGEQMWSVTKEYIRYTMNPNFSCPYFELVVPKALPPVPNAPPPPPNPAQVVERVVERVVYRDRAVPNRPNTEVTAPIPTHIKETIKEFCLFGKEFECPVCMETIAPDTLHITKCGHFFCEACIAQVQPDYSGVRHCPTCRGNL